MENKEISEKDISEIRKRLGITDYEKEKDKVISCIEDYVFETAEGSSVAECKQKIEKLYGRLSGKLGILNLYLQREDVNEIMVNGKNHLFYEKDGEIYHEENILESTEELEEIIRNIAASVHREINEMNPILDARLSDGSRVNAVYKNIAADGPVLTIRKFVGNHMTIEQMTGGKTLSAKCADFLKLLVECGYNLFISGGTSSGKTTFLNALSDFIPADERVLVIEDSRELQLKNIKNLVQMECRNANSMGKGQVTMDMLIRTSLRMRPDRIIVGEVRGREVYDMLQAMNTRPRWKYVHWSWKFSKRNAAQTGGHVSYVS